MSTEGGFDCRKISAGEICVENTLKIIRDDESIFSFKSGTNGQIITTDGSGNLSWTDNNNSGNEGGASYLDDLNDIFINNNNILYLGVSNESTNNLYDIYINNLKLTGCIEVSSGPGSSGDMYYRNSDDKLERLPAGTDGYFLTIENNIPTWAELNNDIFGGGASILDDLTDVLVEDTSLYIGHDPSSTLSTAKYNVAVGITALNAITEGDNNVAMGHDALKLNTSGQENVAIGSNAMAANTSADYCIAIGYNALKSVDSGNDGSNGDDNIAIGAGDCCGSITTGKQNIAIGTTALTTNVSGDDNVAIGRRSLRYCTSTQNVALGNLAGDIITSGSNNVIIGNNSDPSANNAVNQIVIGYNAVGQSDNSITLGNTDVTDIYMNQDSTAAIHCGELVIGSTVIPDQDSSNRYLKTNNNGELEWSTIASGGASELNDLTDVIKENGNIFIANGQDSINQNNSYNNISIGRSTLEDITTGSSNIAFGDHTGKEITSGMNNILVGAQSGQKLTEGQNNVAVGSVALNQGVSPYGCVAIGISALNKCVNTFPSGLNTCIGHASGGDISTGQRNICIGAYSAGNDDNNSIKEGSNNIVIGVDTRASSSNATNQIIIGNSTTGTGDNEVAFGNTSIIAIKAQVTSITGYSDERIKKDIQDSELGLEFIKNLRPVKYKKVNPADYPEPLLEERYKNDSSQRPEDDENVYDGLIAQEVKQTLDNLGLQWSGHSIDENTGKQGLQYGGLVIPLINAVKELNRENDELKTQLSNIFSRLDNLEN